MFYHQWYGLLAASFVNTPTASGVESVVILLRSLSHRVDFWQVCAANPVLRAPIPNYDKRPPTWVFRAGHLLGLCYRMMPVTTVTCDCQVKSGRSPLACHCYLQ